MTKWLVKQNITLVCSLSLASQKLYFDSSQTFVALLAYPLDGLLLLRRDLDVVGLWCAGSFSGSGLASARLVQHLHESLLMLRDLLHRKSSADSALCVQSQRLWAKLHPPAGAAGCLDRAAAGAPAAAPGSAG